MSRLQYDEMSMSNGRSKAFQLGLCLGLLLLLLVSYLDLTRESYLHIATNVYGVQALAGAALGLWLIWKRAYKPRKLLALPSAWICFGLAGWVIGQGVWVWEAYVLKASGVKPVPTAGFSDLLYIPSDVCWLVALWKIFKLLGRRVLTEIDSFKYILVLVWGVVIGSFFWTIEQPLVSLDLLKLVCDSFYILLTSFSMILAVALVLGDNAKLPFPIHQCIRYLCAATAIHGVATFSYVLMTTLERTKRVELVEPWVYFNGSWVDMLFLIAMYCWGVSALKCPIREEELHYTFGTTLRKVREEDIYRAGEISKECARTAHNEDQMIALDSARWILDNIPACWRVVKLGELVVGSTFLFPVPERLMQGFLAGEMTEREMFEEAKKPPFTWDCLYLADASILANHRRRGLASECFKKTIKNIAAEHKDLQIKVYCWPTTLERTRLAEKLRADLEGERISVITKG